MVVTTRYHQAANFLAKACPGMQALCELDLGVNSLILSGMATCFKVRVINDTARGLVALFEMKRVDAHLLRSLLGSCVQDRSFDAACFNSLVVAEEKRFARLFNASPFLQRPDDVEKAIHACLVAFRASSLVEPASEGPELDVDMFIRALHGILTTVMVENLPPPAFFSRFDRTYTLFHVGESFFDSTLGIARSLSLAELRGKILVSLSSEHLSIELPRFLAVERVIDLPLPGASPRRLAVLARTA